MKAQCIDVHPRRMTAIINVTDQPKIIIVNAGKVKEMPMPYNGEVAIRTSKGCVQKYNVIEEETF